MHTRYLLIASAALAIAGGATAEPAKPQAQAHPAVQPAERPAEVMFASAEQVQTMPASAQGEAATPVKHPRAARVTTCRCGNQAER